MKMSEEEIQNKLMKGEYPKGLSESEINSYRHVFHALSKEQVYDLEPDFADRVVDRLATRAETSFPHETLWFILSIAGVGIALAVTLYLTEFKIDLSFLNIFSGYWMFFVFGVALVVIIQIIDKKLVRPGFDQK